MEQDLPKYALHFDDSTNKWWNDFITQQRSRNVIRAKEKWRLNLLEQPTTLPEVSQEALAAAEKLKRLYDKENREAEVLRQKLELFIRSGWLSFLT